MKRVEPVGLFGKKGGWGFGGRSERGNATLCIMDELFGMSDSVSRDVCGMAGESKGRGSGGRRVRRLAAGASVFPA